MSYKTCPNCYSSNVTYVEGDSETVEKFAAYTGAVLGDMAVEAVKSYFGIKCHTGGFVDRVRETKWGTPSY